MAGKLQLDGIRYLLTRLKEYFVQIKDAVKSVNGNEPDENGDILINSVPYADNLQSSLAQQNYDTFVERTSGGSASIQDGDAWLMTAKGTYTHEGFVPEVLTMTVNAETSGITATINRDTFVSYVSESGTTTLTYTSAWDADPANYGITVTGTPVDGDTITVVYVKEVRGTITQTTPLTFVSTGWNLYNPETGYAKVIKYSDEYGFYISGYYTALSFSGTIDGTRTVITPTDGFFSVPSDGFVWVTGGEALTTAIRMTHSDFDPESTQAYEHEDYTESVIDLTDFMGTNFPNGLMAVGTVQDEINLNIMQAYSRVVRMTYSDANLAEARASGRQYEYDTDYIYLERAEAQAISITNHPGGGYTADDHGMEWWTGTELPVETHIVYGNNLKNRLERDVVTKSQDVINRLDFYDVTGAGQFKALGASMGKALNDKLNNQFPDQTMTSFSNRAAFTTYVDNATTASPKKTAIGLGYINWSGAAENIGVSHSGNVLVFSSPNGLHANACIFDPSSGRISVLHKSDGTWGTTWDAFYASDSRKIDRYGASWGKTFSWTVNGAMSLLLINSSIRANVWTASTNDISVLVTSTSGTYTKSGSNGVVKFGTSSSDETYTLTRSGTTVTFSTASNVTTKVLT